MRTGDTGALVLVHRLAVFGQVAAVGVLVAAEATGKGRVVCVGALVRRQGRLDAEGFAAVGIVAYKGLAARVCRQVVG